MQSFSLTGLPSHRPLVLSELTLPSPLSIAVLAPHPDDFDAIGVSMKFLHEQGHIIHVAVLTTGASGIEDGWNGANTPEEKAAIREAEQQASCRFFGLPLERLHFFRLWAKTSHAAPEEDAVAHERFRSFLLSVRPNFVFLPHGNDSNSTHRRTYETFHSIAAKDNLSLIAFLNLDAKTISMRPDIYMYFGEEEAAWKGKLLRFHRSQHERNFKTRGYGFDERVLGVNREEAAKTKTNQLYAEVFELQQFGAET